MGNTKETIKETIAHKLYDEIEMRKDWFFECQLRRLNILSLRDVEVKETNPDPRINLISEPDDSNPPLGSKKQKESRVYLDSGEKVWTQEEREQRSAFKDISTGGGRGNWLYYEDPVKLKDKLRELKLKYEETKFSSEKENFHPLNNYVREDIISSKDDPAKYQTNDHNKLAHAISRVAITEKKPWLIPEVFKSQKIETLSDEENWIINGEIFIKNYENELNEISGGVPIPKFSLDNLENYRGWISGLLKKLVDPDKPTSSSNGIKVKFMDIDPSIEKWQFNIKIQTPAFPSLQNIANYSFSNNVKYWIDVCNNGLNEIYVNKSDSDMGMCLIMRTLYLYGTLPLNLEEKKIRWRNRKPPNSVFMDFFTMISARIRGNIALHTRLDTIREKLKILLEETASVPRSFAIHFSPIAQEIIKQCILGYKFWLDEPYFVYDYHGEDQDKDKPQGINKARNDTGKGHMFAEMEYWSENHYIMFASSEYLAGQFWQNESFQPARDFLKQEDKDKKFGVLSGQERMERGRARILKWLNNKLLFGWTEFNSSGYYREHLWSLLNLVDFAMDDEIQKKATMVTDLLLFDVIRFLHKGSMGACGGRSQFPSKNNGWDNALGDLVEIILGTRGVFSDDASEIGCSFATSSYTVPDVILEIGALPPIQSFIDRSRVSISFDEAPKYGIQYSQKSDEKDSLVEGYKTKLLKYFPALEKVNAEIERTHDGFTHTGYRSKQDDTVFWWSQSAYYNKQVVNNTLDNVENFKLKKCAVFSLLRKVLQGLSVIFEIKDFGVTVLPVLGNIYMLDLDDNPMEKAMDQLSIFLEGSTRSRANIYTYSNGDIMLSSIQNFRTGQLNYQSNVNQATISTGINVFSTAGFAGLSISDFPVAFLGASGGALGGSLLNKILVGGTGGIITATTTVAGAIIATAVNQFELDGSNIFGEQGDGPGWWTGYWALPMVVQHENASIMAYDFHWMQRRLTDVGSHVLFPTFAFDQHTPRRSSAYEDDNFLLADFSLDLKDLKFGYGKRGYWIFGKKAHSQNPDDNEEAYIGVFSNKEPDWLNKNFDFYKAQIKIKNETALDDLKNEADDILEKLEDEDQADSDTILDAVVSSVQKNLGISSSKDAVIDLVIKDLMKPGSEVTKNNQDNLKNLAGHYIDIFHHQKIWAHPISEDFFANKDWYAPGKNIWITQVGNKKEYGSFENFMDLVSKAKVEVDDASDIECVYHIPKPDGSSHLLSLKYKDEIKLNNQPFQSDFYPRFENMFIRGGLVEWGQREYVIEYNGKFLIHDFSDMEVPIRSEKEIDTTDMAFVVKGLVIHLKTGDEEMEVFTVATATVNIGSKAVAVDEVIAAGKVDENTTHDVEWIFFDMRAISDPDMTIDIAHNAIPGRGDDDCEWKMTYTFNALMGDRSIKKCSVRPIPLETFYLRDNHKSTGSYPFSVQLNLWRIWSKQGNTPKIKSWMIAEQPRSDLFYFDYIDQLAIDDKDILWHSKLGSFNAFPFWAKLTPENQEPLPGVPHRLFAYSTQPGYLFIFLIANRSFFARWLFPGNTWETNNWIKMNLSYQPMLKMPFMDFEIPDTSLAPISIPLGSLSHVCATLIDSSTVTPKVYLSGADGNFYVTSEWPLDDAGRWRKIETASIFAALQPVPFQLGGNFIFVLDDKRTLWLYPTTSGKDYLLGFWQQLPVGAFTIQSFTLGAFDDKLQVIALTDKGEIWAIQINLELTSAEWKRVGINIDFKTSSNAQVSCISAITGRLDIFVPGTDEKLYTTWWTEESGWENGHNWIAVEGNNEDFKAAEKGDVKAISRVNGQIEIFATDSDQNIWKNWWS